VLEGIELKYPSVTGITWGMNERERFAMNDSKPCSHCKQIKEFSEYSFQNRERNQLMRMCKSCNAQRQSIYYKKNKQRLLQQKQTYYQENRPLLLVNAQEYRDKNPEKRQDAMKRSYAKNPYLYKATATRYKARKRNAGIFKVSVKEDKKLRNSPCFYCGSKDNIQIDHIVPVSRGGRHSIGNLVAACQKCNTQKNKWFITEWNILKKEWNK